MEKRKKWIKYACIAAAAALFFVLYLRGTYHLILQTDMDSDYSYVLMEANDVVNGNFFLSGWTQTGISFFLTDLLFFMVGAAVFGLTRMGYVTAVVLMIAATFVTAYLLVDKKNLKNTVLYIALTAFPTVVAVNMQRSHVGGYIWSFLIFAAAGWCVKKGKVNNGCLAAIVLLTAMCSMSDMAALVFGGGALLLLCLYKIIFEQNSDRKLYGWLAGAAAAGAVLGLVMDKLYYFIGGADKNSFVGEKIFIEVQHLPDKIGLYLKSVFVLGNADAWGAEIFSVNTIISLFYAVFVAAGLYLMVKNIVLFLRHKNEDFISVLLSAGLALVSVLFIFTSIGIDVYTSRYFGTFPYINAVLLCRYLTRTGLWEKMIYTSRIQWKIPIMLLAVLCIAGGIYKHEENTKEWSFTSDPERLGHFLESQGLQNGYGSYLDSSAASVPTGGDVNVRQIVLNGEKYIFPYYWFCKQEWYQEEANFIVIREDGDQFGLTEEMVKAVVGMPQRRLTYDGYLIYVYDWDLSQMINLDDWRYR